MERATELCKRVSFARICVEIRQVDELPDIIQVDIKGMGHTDVVVKYSWRPMFCSICNNFGLKDQKCNKLTKVWVPTNVTNVPDQVNSSGEQNNG